MFKLWYSIIKEFRLLLRDRVGLTLMFAMPVLLVMVITGLQNNTFELVNENKIPLLVCNRDTGESSEVLLDAINKIGMFEIVEVPANTNESELADLMHQKDALISISIPMEYSFNVASKAKRVSDKALFQFGVTEDRPVLAADTPASVPLYYHPVLRESYRQSIQGALLSAFQIVENKTVLQSLFQSLTGETSPPDMEAELWQNRVNINQLPVSRDGSRSIPNATQHNIPAWTLFAMFFIVTSLGSNVVKEKLSGSFVRLKTLPTNYLTILAAKQITYLTVCLMQVAVIFSIGIWLFPLMDLPKLNLPSDLGGLFVVSLLCGWCAVSYALAVGTFAQTGEQANGFGAVSIVILAAIGGILVPAFAMPDSFQQVLKISPLHWGLEAYYGLFLEGGKLADVWIKILPLVAITVVIQLLVLWGLKRKNLI